MSLSDSDAAVQARSEAARHAISARWAGTTPEQRRAATRKARVAGAVSNICNNAHTLTDEQRARILAALGGGR
jgi:hypothetical protein